MIYRSKANYFVIHCSHTTLSEASCEAGLPKNYNDNVYELYTINWM